MGGVSYSYDSEGNRITVTEGGQTSRFVVNPVAKLSQALVRTRANGTKTYYVYGHGLLYDIETTSAGVETAIRNYHFDYRGSTVALSDPAGTALERVEYSTYGRITRRVGTTVDTPFLFNGMYGVMTDPNSLYHMRARYYNPYIRRFVNADPMGLAAGLNFYAYADGDPINMVDPSGLVIETAWDVANIAMGVYSLQDNIRSGNWGWAALDGLGLAYDGVATAIPFLPAGVSAGFKAARAGNSAVRSVNAGLDVARISEQTHQTAKTFDAVSSVPWQAALDGSKIHRKVASEASESMRYFDITYMPGANRASGIKPDMIGGGIWADITTSRRWRQHVNDYSSGFGEGIPIFYERGIGVVGTTRLLSGAGLGLSILK